MSNFMLNKKTKSKKDKDLTLLEKYIEDTNKQSSNKENLTLLERGLQQGNEFKKLERKKKVVPAKVDTEHKIETEYSSPYEDKYEKFLYYAEKYRIPFSRGGFKKSFKELAEDIHKYEMKHLKHILKNGLDKKYQEYGHYISII